MGRLRRTIRLEGPRAATAIYAKAIARRLLRGKIGNKLASTVPTQVKKEALAALEQRIVKLDAAVTDVLQKAAQGDFVILCNGFPGAGQNYGGEFIRSRYGGYLEQGLKGSVIHLSNRIKTNTVDPFEGTETAIIRISDGHLNTLAGILAAGQANVLVHSPPPNVQKVLQKKIALERLIYWFHGFEVRDYRRLYFNYTTSELAVLKQRLNEITQWRIEANKISFAEPAIKKVFVSNYLKEIAARDNGAQIENGHIIPNFIDGDVFAYHEKTANQMKRFLLIRAFERRNYGNDIAIEAIKIASKWDGFEDLHFTIRGFGAEFAELTEGLQGFSNVVIQEQYSSPEEMAELHKEHGVFLCPSRFDTQGVTMGEAMASGLVCITNPVTGIPEYIDESCGLLAPADDPMAYARAIWHAKENLHAMLDLSKAAAQRARAQCGRDQTVGAEIKLVQSSSS
ncbi:glycosyltransferase family 4 protein [Planktotalea frisia]|nr:glycosyltransferase family 4 protein [Planktotalea frisia]